jgi:hypothetical protein
LYVHEPRLLAQLFDEGLGIEVLVTEADGKRLGYGVEVDMVEGVGVGLVVVTGEEVGVVDGLGLVWLVQLFLRQ